MSIMRVGSTSKYSDGWDNAFGKKRKSTASVKKQAKRATKKTATKRKKKS